MDGPVCVNEQIVFMTQFFFHSYYPFSVWGFHNSYVAVYKQVFMLLTAMCVLPLLYALKLGSSKWIFLLNPIDQKTINLISPTLQQCSHMRVMFFPCLHTLSSADYAYLDIHKHKQRKDMQREGMVVMQAQNKHYFHVMLLPKCW